MQHFKNYSIIDIDGETWEPLVGYSGRYLISSKGRVKSFYHSKPIIIKQREMVGYLYVFLHNDFKVRALRAHRLVALHFIDNPENKRTVNHKNGIKTDNRVENLEWSTHSENNKHACVTGLMNFTGERNNFSTLTNVQALEIYQSNLTANELGVKYRVSTTTIYNIRKGKSWGLITQKAV